MYKILFTAVILSILSCTSHKKRNINGNVPDVLF